MTTAFGFPMRPDPLHVDPRNARSLRAEAPEGAPPAPPVLLVRVSIPRHTGRGGKVLRHEVIAMGRVSPNHGDGPDDRFWQARCGHRSIGQAEEGPESLLTCELCISRRTRGTMPMGVGA